MFSAFKGFEDKDKVMWKRYTALGDFLTDKEAKGERFVVLSNLSWRDECEIQFIMERLLIQTKLCIDKLEKDLDQPHHRRIKTVLSCCLDAYNDFYASMHKLQRLLTPTVKCLYSMCRALQQRISEHAEIILDSLFTYIMKDHFWLAVFYRSSSLFRVDQEAFQAMIRSIENPKEWEVMEFNNTSMACHHLLPDPDDFLHATDKTTTSPWASMFDVLYQSSTGHIKYYKHRVNFSK